MVKRFGWWPRNSVVDAVGLRAEPIEEYAESIAEVRNHPRAYGDWFYPPLQPVHQVSGETKQPPETPADIYELPVTHRLTGNETWMDDEFANFIVTLIGFADGLRLLPEGWVHFYRTPIKCQKLTDLFCDPKELAAVIDAAANWWKERSIEERRAMFAAVHWYVFSGLYHHEFEEFAAKYTVLDTLYWIHRRQVGGSRIPHAQRPSDLAAAYGVVIPSWAAMADGSCRLAEIRNALIHEGQFGGKPIGFAHLPETMLTLEFGHFLSRLIIGMLGVKCSYVQSSSNTRSIYSLGLLP